MATYQLIASNVLGTTASSVTFSSIPQTYTDLVLRMSTRMSGANAGLFVRPNDASTGYTCRRLKKEDASFAADSLTGNYWFGVNNGNWSDSQFFAHNEYYMTDYTNTSWYKVATTMTATMENSTTQYMGVYGQRLTNSTNAITSIVIYPEGAGNFETNSGFYLYGISNA